jgi:hypothetical protein
MMGLGESALVLVSSSLSRPTRAATAFAEPAPSPPWMGRRFSMWIATLAGVPKSSSASDTIFHAVLRLSVGTRGSLEVRLMDVVGAEWAVTVTKSCSSNVW